MQTPIVAKQNCVEKMICILRWNLHFFKFRSRIQKEDKAPPGKPSYATSYAILFGLPIILPFSINCNPFCIIYKKSLLNLGRIIFIAQIQSFAIEMPKSLGNDRFQGFCCPPVAELFSCCSLFRKGLLLILRPRCHRFWELRC